MHLLNVHTRKLQYFIGNEIPPYAILSHTWGKDEVTMQDLTNNANVESKEGYEKIRLTCWQASVDGLDWAWVDTCCIDKTSSSELSEAINSMFNWYRRCAKCYAYISDVVISCPPMADIADGNEVLLDFSRTRWFTRGWTLQELIAPKDVIFFDRNWDVIGTRRRQLLQTIVETTGIDRHALSYQSSLSHISVAQRMSWASKRTTTRKEDEAYCLLGIFGVNMPLLYGEEGRAFMRLQEEIVRTSTDQSIFAWNIRKTSERSAEDGYLFATSPKEFENSGSVSRTAYPEKYSRIGTASYTLSNAGLRITLPVIKLGIGRLYTRRRRYIGVLRCLHNSRYLGLQLERFEFGPQQDMSDLEVDRCRMIPLTTEDVLRAKETEVVIQNEPRKVIRDRKPKIVPCDSKDQFPKVPLRHFSTHLTFSDLCGSGISVERTWPENGWNFSDWEWTGGPIKARSATLTTTGRDFGPQHDTTMGMIVLYDEYRDERFGVRFSLPRHQTLDRILEIVRHPSSDLQISSESQRRLKRRFDLVRASEFSRRIELSRIGRRLAYRPIKRSIHSDVFTKLSVTSEFGRRDDLLLKILVENTLLGSIRYGPRLRINIRRRRDDWSWDSSSSPEIDDQIVQRGRFQTRYTYHSGSTQSSL